MSKKKVTEQVKDLLMDFLKENNYELFDVEYVKEGNSWILRILIDKLKKSDQDEEEYIGTEDCEKVSSFISEELDKIDILEKQYFLEVSSPGLDRPLRNEDDYIKYKGRIIEISLYKPLDGQKMYMGELVSLENENIIIIDEKKNKIEIPISKAAIVRLAVIF
ncbi:MAG: ribosome maturation factor RimP [Eubacteriales bacterium]